jgi:predicted aldo/keto reductase-like oxidoreductase
MKKLKKDGKAKHIGFSFHGTTEALDEILLKHPEMEFAQLQINYMDWYDGMAKEWQETAIKHNTPIIIMEPVKGGTLASLPKEAEDVFKAAGPEASVASWAIRFAASLSGVLTTLSGMSNMEQVEDNLKTMGDFKPLAAQDYTAIENALSAYRGVSYIPCTACKYCADCPQGIEIDQIFSIYNQYKRTGNKWPLTQMYGCLDAKTNIKNCTECGTCVGVCPQNIDVPKKFKEIKKAVS